MSSILDFTTAPASSTSSASASASGPNHISPSVTDMFDPLSSSPSALPTTMATTTPMPVATAPTNPAVGKQQQQSLVNMNPAAAVLQFTSPPPSSSSSSSSSTAPSSSASLPSSATTGVVPPQASAASSSSSTADASPSLSSSPAFTPTTLPSSNASASMASSEQSAFVAGSTFNFNDFLEKMRHPSSFDLVKSIKVFITSFLERPYQAEEQVDMVRNFLSKTATKLATHQLWKGATDEELDNAVEGLEKYLMHKIYQVAFSNPSSDDAYLDECLEIRIRRLSFLTAANLDIKDGRISEASLQLTDAELRKMNTYKAPRDKLICILNCCKLIYNILQQIEGHPAGADEFLPILIYVILKSNPPKLHSNLLYIQRFRNPDKMASEAGYYYTNLVSAVSFIENMKSNQLSIDPKFFESEYAKSAHLVPKTPAPVISQKGKSLAQTSAAAAASTVASAATAPAPAASLAPTPASTPASATASTAASPVATSTTAPAASVLSPSLPAGLIPASGSQPQPQPISSSAAAAAKKAPVSTPPQLPPKPTGVSSGPSGSPMPPQAPAGAKADAPHLESTASAADMFVSPEIQGAPIARFLNARAEQLTIHEVFLLLNDYKRLAKQNVELTKTLCLNLGISTNE